VVTPKLPEATCLMELRRSRRWVGAEALFVFAAFAGVGAGTDAVHGDGESFVGFLTDGAEGHGAGGEALDDLGGGLDFIESGMGWPSLKVINPRRVQRARLWSSWSG
jgi:hypothetical protein